MFWCRIEVRIIKVHPLPVSFDEPVFCPMHGQMESLNINTKNIPREVCAYRALSSSGIAGE